MSESRARGAPPPSRRRRERDDNAAVRRALAGLREHAELLEAEHSRAGGGRRAVSSRHRERAPGGQEGEAGPLSLPPARARATTSCTRLHSSSYPSARTAPPARALRRRRRASPRRVPAPQARPSPTRLCSCARSHARRHEQPGLACTASTTATAPRSPSRLSAPSSRLIVPRRAGQGLVLGASALVDRRRHRRCRQRCHLHDQACTGALALSPPLCADSPLTSCSPAALAARHGRQPLRAFAPSHRGLSSSAHPAHLHPRRCRPARRGVDRRPPQEPARPVAHPARSARRSSRSRHLHRRQEGRLSRRLERERRRPREAQRRQCVHVLLPLLLVLSLMARCPKQHGRRRAASFCTPSQPTTSRPRKMCVPSSP